MKEKLKQWQMISRALLYSGLPLNKADGYIGKVFVNIALLLGLCHEANSFSGNTFLRYMNNTRAMSRKQIANRKISVILDESPDKIGRPVINTLILLNDFHNNRKIVLLVDTRHN